MKCKTCGNTKEFTMIIETAFWNDTKKKFENAEKDSDEGFILGGDEYYVCDVCMKNHKEGFVDTEGDY